MKLLAAIPALLAFSMPAQAAMTAKSLVDGCRVASAIEEGNPDGLPAEYMEERLMLAGMCLGYIDGIVGGHTSGARNDPSARMFCLPGNVTTAQISRVMIAKLKQYPEHENMNALPFTLGILAGTWPCSPGT